VALAGYVAVLSSFRTTSRVAGLVVASALKGERTFA
jgi:hypothetical protein